MAWGPFSAEAVELHTLVGKFDKQGRITDALAAIEKALEAAHREGPSRKTYEQAEAEWSESAT